jgi:hypothetical protein
MTTQTSPDAVFVGGPRDGSLASTGGAPLVEVRIDGLVHRYVVTTKTREHDGTAYTVYTYDGEIDPDGAQPGAEAHRRHT